jgi:MFS family permease
MRPAVPSSKSSSASSGSRASVWRLPGYPWFYLAATLGRVANEMLPVAVVLLILDRTGRPSLAGAAVAAGSLPSMLTGPVLGAWLDRTRHRRSALAANQLLLASALVGMLLLAGRSPAWVVLGLAVAGGIGAPMLTGGITSMIPLLVPAGLLRRANALEASSFNSAAVLGPALAGGVAARFGPAAAIGLEAAIAVLSLLAIARMPPVAAVSGDGTASLAAALRSGLAHLARTPVLRGVTVTTSIESGAQGLLPLALPLLSEHLGAGRAAAGYLYAAMEVGGIVGAFLAVRLTAGWRPERVVLGGIGLAAAGTGGLALVPNFQLALVVAAATGLALGPSFAALFAVRQEWSPSGLRAQIFTTAASLKVGAFAVGAALAGPAAAAFGTRGAVLATAAIGLLAVPAGFAASRSAPGGRPTQATTQATAPAEATTSATEATTPKATEATTAATEVTTAAATEATAQEPALSDDRGDHL